MATTGLVATACTLVGPDYERPPSPLAPDWYRLESAAFDTSARARADWWQLLQDPVLDSLIAEAFEHNNNLEIAALRVLESRAQLAIAVGNQWPQSQAASGGATVISASENAANTVAGDLRYTQFDIGVGIAWELDFWGRYRRAIEAADAAYLGSIAAYQQAMLLVTAQVALSYVAMRTFEEQLRITRDNLAVQKRSFDIVDVQYRNGNTSELDVLQAKTLLLSTEASIPALETGLAQSRHALATLLGRPPGPLELGDADTTIPQVPETLPVGVPADLLRQRPDVRQAESLAMAQSASVGFAEANLYPSFSLGGSLSLVAAADTDSTRTGESGFDQLFRSDSISYAVGPSFVWPFLNYGRLKNNVRVQDALLQQALTAYRESVIQAARDVEDAVVQLQGAREQDRILAETVQVAERSADVALLRFQEGFSDYQRVLDAQQVLFSQQGRSVAARGDIVTAFIDLYLALGGGWGPDGGLPVLREETIKTMRERSDWGDMIDEYSGVQNEADNG